MRIALGLLIGMTGCAHRAKYVDPDAVSKVEGTGLEARDLRAVAGEMTVQLLGSPAVAAHEGPARVAILPIENRTRFLIDPEIVGTLVSDQVINGGGGRIAVVNRDLLDEILAERERLRTGAVEGGPVGALAGVDFFLEGEMRGLAASDARNQSDYLVVRFQLTDVRSGIVSWSNSWEVKKEGGWSVLYQ
jgi:PBP1b-binding outer membrane lipoprotein LpoB